MEMDGCQEILHDPEARGCTEDNRLSDNQADLATCDLSEALNAQKEVDLGTEDHDLLPELHKSREAEGTRAKGKYNLRKSLAWDSAFFTSAGVLDAEELSSMITGADKGKKQFLPGIQEDITASTESISSLESDSLNLETLEEELFVDIRASIQRSNKKQPNLTNSSDMKANVEVESTSISSLKDGVTSSSQDKNPKPGSKRPTGLETISMSKSLAKQNVWNQGSRKVVKKDAGHSQVTSIAKIGEKTTTLGKTPKAISNSNSTLVTVKRDPTGIGRGKTDCGSSKLCAPATTSKGMQPPKVSGGGGKMLPRRAVPSKSSSLNTSTCRMQSTNSSTSSDTSHGLPSEVPPEPLIRRKNPGRSNTVASPRPMPKILSRTAPPNKPLSSMSSRLTPKVGSSISPASSTSDWSSVSSSTSSMVIQKFNNSRSSKDISSSKSTNRGPIPLPSRNLCADQTSRGHENRKVNISNGMSSKTSTTGAAMQTSTKPSGLRMPSPKIGFFDGVKSSPRTPNGHKPSQPGLRTLLTKSGATASSPARISHGKLKCKAPTTRMSTSASPKPDSTKVTSVASSQEKSNVSMNSSSVSLDIKDSPCLARGIEGIEHGMKQVVDKGTDAIVKGNLGDLNTNGLVVPEDNHGVCLVSPQKEASVSSPSQISNVKLKGINSPITGLLPSSARSKPDSPEGTSLASTQDKLHASINSLSVSWDVKDSPSLFLEAKGKEPEVCQMAEKIQVDNGVKHVVDAGTDANIKGNLGNLIINDFMVPKDILVLRTAIPETEAAASSPILTSNTKLMGIKSPTTRISLSSASSQRDSLKTASSTPYQEKLHDSINTSVSLDAKDPPSLSIGVNGNKPEEGCQRAEKVDVDDGVKQVVDARACTCAIVEENLGNLIINDFMAPEDIPGMCTSLAKNDAAACSPNQNSNGELKGRKFPTARPSPSLARSKPDPPLVTSHEKLHTSINSSPVSWDVKDFSTFSLRVEGNGTAEKVYVDNKVTQVVVETSNVADFEGVSQKDMAADQNGPENNSHQTCQATEKENDHDRYQGEGITGSKNVCSPKNELYREEYDTIRPPFTLKNNVCSNEYIDGSRKLDALVGDETSGHKPLV